MITLTLWRCESPPPPDLQCINIQGTYYCRGVTWRNKVARCRCTEPPWPGCELLVVHYSLPYRCSQPENAIPDIAEVRYTSKVRLRDIEVTVRYFPRRTLIISSRFLKYEELEELKEICKKGGKL